MKQATIKINEKAVLPSNVEGIVSKDALFSLILAEVHVVVATLSSYIARLNDREIVILVKS